MFVLSKGAINKYYFLYHFYNWYAFKNNIMGLDREAQELLNKYLFVTTDTKNLQLADIYKLKDAIRQDKAAIEFVIKLCRNYEGTKQALKKCMKQEVPDYKYSLIHEVMILARELSLFSISIPVEFASDVYVAKVD